MAVLVANRPSSPNGLETRFHLFGTLTDKLKSQGFACLTLEYLGEDLRELFKCLIGKGTLTVTCFLDPTRISYQVPFVYDRDKLRARFRDLNAMHRFKSKPVHVVPYDHDRGAIARTLMTWEQLCCTKPPAFSKVKPPAYGISDLLLSQGQSIAKWMRQGMHHFPTYSVKAVVDDATSTIQAVSLSHIHQPGVCSVDYLVVAPHNLGGKKNSQCQVEGAGALLIEEGLNQALTDLSYAPALLPLSALERASVITYASGSADTYYEYLFFQNMPDDGTRTHVLTGLNSARFLSRYGGRG